MPVGMVHILTQTCQGAKQPLPHLGLQESEQTQPVDGKL